MAPSQAHLNVKTNNPTKYDKILSYGVKVAFTVSGTDVYNYNVPMSRSGGEKHRELRCFRRVSSSFSTGTIRHIAV